MIKKQIRAAFRNAVFTRDKHRCKNCGYQSTPEKATEEIDAHHIVNRNNMVDGGYIKENGITLCKIGNNCHLKAELGDLTEKQLFWMINVSK